MKFTARVTSTDGKPLAAGKVEIVAASGGKVAKAGTGKVAKGALSATGDPGPVWGLRIDGRPVVAIAVSVTGETTDLGEIVLLSDGMAWPAFHATEGLVFGIPRAARPTARKAAPAPTETPTETLFGDPLPLKTGMTFGDMLGSTAQQFGKVASLEPSFSLTGASVRLKGVPTSTESAIGLDFPTPEQATTGTGLSELAFSLKPILAGGSPVPPPPTGPAVPNMTGYTRELAMRKLVSAGFAVEVSNEVVTDAAQGGRVVRQVPKAGTPFASGGLVRLFIGKRNGS